MGALMMYYLIAHESEPHILAWGVGGERGSKGKEAGERVCPRTLLAAMHRCSGAAVRRGSATVLLSLAAVRLQASSWRSRFPSPCTPSSCTAATTCHPCNDRCVR